ALPTLFPYTTLFRSVFELAQLLDGLRCSGSGLGQRARIEGESRPRARRPAVGARKPVRHMEQLAHRDERVFRRNRAMTVNGAVRSEEHTSELQSPDQ